MRLDITPAPAPETAAVIAAAVQAALAAAPAPAPSDTGSAWYRRGLLEGVAILEPAPTGRPPWHAGL